MRLQSAIFDMDGTLLDSMGIWTGLGSRMLRLSGVEPAPDLEERLKVLTIRGGAELCRTEYHLAETAQALEGRIRGEVERFYREEVEAKPGVKKFLSLLKMEGVWMYVATATERPLAEAALRRTGLEGYFRGMVTCEEAGRGKDSPEVFERALRRLRSNKGDTVVFEDALHAIETAKSAGFRVAAVYDPSAQKDQPRIRELADYYIRSYEELFEAREPE